MVKERREQKEERRVEKVYKGGEGELEIRGRSTEDERSCPKRDWEDEGRAHYTTLVLTWHT